MSIFGISIGIKSIISIPLSFIKRGKETCFDSKDSKKIKILKVLSRYGLCDINKITRLTNENELNQEISYLLSFEYIKQYPYKKKVLFYLSDSGYKTIYDPDCWFEFLLSD